DWILSKQKEFLGKRSLRRSDTARGDRKQLVGLLPEDRDFVAPEGAHLVASEAEAAFSPERGSPSIGHVTSSYYSSNLERSFALALVQNGRARIGGDIFCAAASGLRRMQVVAPVFFDPEGARRDGVP